MSEIFQSKTLQQADIGGVDTLEKLDALLAEDLNQANRLAEGGQKMSPILLTLAGRIRRIYHTMPYCMDLNVSPADVIMTIRGQLSDI